MVRGLDKETSFEEFLIVIHAVEKKPGLYQRFNSLNAPEARFEAWNEVAKETNLPALTCRERWRYARQVFVKHVRGDYVGKAGSKLVRHLHFLKPHITLKKPPSHKTAAGTRQNKSKCRQDETNSNIVDLNTLNDGTSDLGNVEIEATDFLNNFHEQDSRDGALQDIKLEEADAQMPVNIGKVDKDGNAPESDLNCRHADTREVFKDDTDLCFLKSVLPEMKMMNSRQKTLFKSKVMNLAIDILYNANV